MARVDRKFGNPLFWGGRIKVVSDGDYVTVKGAWSSGRARARKADVSHAGIGYRSAGIASAKYVDLYGANGTVLASTRFQGLNGKAERAVAFVDAEVAAYRAAGVVIASG